MMNHVLSRAVIGVFAFLVPGAAAIAAEKAPEQRSFDPAATCARMMRDSGVSEEGKKAMQEFMRSPRASEAMTNMMAMARQMGDGDVMRGMIRMMQMMGSMGGGMMGGPSGPMLPDGHQPGK